MTPKNERQQAVRRIIRERAIGNQAELVEQLTKSGLQATQASVSRDLRELGLLKLDGRYVMPGRLNGSPSGGPASELITHLIPVGSNLVVVRTSAGAAGAVAAALDQRGLPEMVGTIAGDDTIFVAVRSRAAQGRLMNAVRGMALPAQARSERH